MACSSWVLAIPAVIYAFLAWVIYLLLAQPARFVDLFVRRFYRRWGIRVEVEDAALLRRQARRLGVLLGVFMALHATVVYGVLTGVCKLR